jgi:3-deoxy-D-manno-octulosonate 8-phosphate phosphatase (KDO 8-P phosphatase)
MIVLPKMGAIKNLNHIRLLALDSDGVLTDGGVYIFEDGHEFRRFDIKDGLGLKRIMRVGLEVAIISSGSYMAVRVRAIELGIKHVLLGQPDKLECLKVLCRTLDIRLDQVAYIGDDLPDLPVLQSVGLPIGTVDAVSEIRQAVVYLTSARGGHGAVREVCELFLSDLQGSSRL